MRYVLKKYFAIVFAFSILLGVFHHHNDLKQHNECQICQINANLSVGDTPSETSTAYLLEAKKETPQTPLASQTTKKLPTSYQTRAPPQVIL